MAATVSRDESRLALRLFHPKGNIVTREMVAALATALDAAAGRPHLKLVTLEAEGTDFSFGASVPEHAPETIGRVLPEMHALIHQLLAVPAVTAAVVRGRCLGGGFELALACDVIFAADNATFGLPEVALGVFAPAASVLLPARVGAARATRALVTGEARSAVQWRDAGLVEFVVENDTLEAEVDRWFDLHLAARSAAALRHAVAAARLGLRAQVAEHLPQLERLYLKDLMQTADAAEGVRAFVEKRPPRWSDE